MNNFDRFSFVLSKNYLEIIYLTEMTDTPKYR